MSPKADIKATPGWLTTAAAKNIKWQEICLKMGKKKKKRRCRREEGDNVLNYKEIVHLLLYAGKTLFYLYVIHSWFWSSNGEGVDTPQN